MVAPHQTKKYFFQWRQNKQALLDSPPQRFFNVNSKQFKSNCDRSEKYSENTEVPKKEMNNCHSARRLWRIRKTAYWKCSTKWLFWKIRENFQENIRGSIFSLILLRKALHQGCFLTNVLKHLRTAVSEIIQ